MKHSESVPSGYIFSERDLKKLILPLIVEQLLSVLVGMSDSIMVAYAGEASVSGVSLVDTVFVLIINIFTALATGGAVVAGQSLGAQKDEEGCQAVNQLVLFIAAAGLGVAALIYCGKDVLLDLVFGKISPDVRANASTYLLITTASIPFIALYNAGAAVFRAQGNSRLPMRISILMNCINVVGNAILIYGANMGAAGAAIPTLVSRAFAGVVILWRIAVSTDRLHFARPFRLRFDGKILRNILCVGIPNGIENSMFQLGKILLLSIISTLGTASITANAIGNSICGFEVLAASAIGIALLTVSAQCVGAGDYEQLRYYTRKLMKQAYFYTFFTSGLICLLTPLILRIYNISAEAQRYAFAIIIMHGVSSMIIWPFAFAFPSVLRASGDAKYCMIVSSLSMWVVRIVGAFFAIQVLGLGVFGAWVVMPFDWTIRTVFFYARYRKRVIKGCAQPRP